MVTGLDNYYVYVHYRLDKDVPMYVGRGKRRRAWAKGNNDRSERWHRTVQKYGYRVEILVDGLLDWEACQIEIDMIALYRKMGYPLCNMSSGGEHGSVGVKASPETRKKLSDIMRGPNHPNWGKSRPVEVSKKVSNTLKIRYATNPDLKEKASIYAKQSKGHTGKHHSDELKAKFARSYPAFKNKFTGEIIPAGTNFRKMCAERGLATGNMYKLRRGEIRHNKGWELYIEETSV